jgi:hypothetical protein
MGRWVGVVHDTQLHLLAFWYGVVSRLLAESVFLAERQCYAFLSLYTRCSLLFAFLTASRQLRAVFGTLT